MINCVNVDLEMIEEIAYASSFNWPLMHGPRELKTSGFYNMQS